MKYEYFLGIGQGNRAKRWLAQRRPDINFHIAPNYFAGHNDDEFAAIGLDSMKSAIGGSDDAEPYVLIAESQAAPAAIFAVKKALVRFPTRLILIQPLGLNQRSFGNQPRLRRKELLHRSRVFWQHPNQSLHIPGNRWTVGNLLMSALRHPWNVDKALLYGASQDCRDELVAVARIIPIDIFASDDDSLFPRVQVNVTAPGVTMHTTVGTHFNRATPKGLKQLNDIFRSL